jgi:hypothetical protein
LLQHLCGGLAQPAFDLAQVRVGDAGLLGELTQRQLRCPTLRGNELTERVELVRDLVASDSCHVNQCACNCKQTQAGSMQP